MLSAVVRPLALACVLLFPLAASVEVDPTQPLAAAASEADGQILVSWLPAPATADYFLIYGLTEDGEVPLGSSSETHALVPPGYRTYGVAAIVEGIQSKVTPAVNIAVPQCRPTVYSVNPPGAYVGCNGVAIVNGTAP